MSTATPMTPEAALEAWHALMDAFEADQDIAAAEEKLQALCQQVAPGLAHKFSQLSAEPFYMARVNQSPPPAPKLARPGKLRLPRRASKASLSLIHI